MEPLRTLQRTTQRPHACSCLCASRPHKYSPRQLHTNSTLATPHRHLRHTIQLPQFGTSHKPFNLATPHSFMDTLASPTQISEFGQATSRPQQHQHKRLNLATPRKHLSRMNINTFTFGFVTQTHQSDYATQASQLGYGALYFYLYFSIQAPQLISTTQTLYFGYAAQTHQLRHTNTSLRLRH